MIVVVEGTLLASVVDDDVDLDAVVFLLVCLVEDDGTVIILLIDLVVVVVGFVDLVGGVDDFVVVGFDVVVYISEQSSP